MILAASWIAVYTLQMLFFDVMIIGSRTFSGLLMYIIAFIILLAAGVFLVLTSDRRSGNLPPARWKLGVILIAIVLLIGVAGVEVLGRRNTEPDYSGATQRPGIIYEMREMLHGRFRDEFATNRFYIWRIALEAYPEHPILGTGPDTFEKAFPEEAQWKYGEHYDKAHNEYIQILICQGILGLICYLVFLAAACFKAIPKAFGNPLLMAVLAAFIGYIVQAFFNISLPIASQMLWVFAGMLVAMCRRVTDAIDNTQIR